MAQDQDRDQRRRARRCSVHITLSLPCREQKRQCRTRELRGNHPDNLSKADGSWGCQGEVDGLLGPQTRAAIANYQRDHRLYETSAIDQPTLESLGMA